MSILEAAPVSRSDTAGLMLDHAALSELVGAPVRATHLRHKPGLSTTAALVDAADGFFVGWAQACHEGHLDKVRNAVRAAAERGLRVHVRLVQGSPGMRLVHGSIDTDPQLRRGLRTLGPALPSVESSVQSGRLRVLRYNPHRRLVLRRDVPDHQPLGIRVTADKQPDANPTRRVLEAAGVPVLRPTRSQDIRRTRRVTVWPWYGCGDLAGCGLTAALAGRAARRTGGALARLHGIAQVAGDVRHGPAEIESALVGLAGDLHHLDPSAAGRTAGLTEQVLRRLGDGPAWRGAVLAHGDFSADQVLVDHDGHIRLIDFDRMGLAPAALDLGSFAAMELLTSARPPTDLPLTGRVLEGYRLAGGAEPEAATLTAWTARALLTRVMEPFRAGRSDWSSGVHARLDQIEEVLAQ